MQNFWSKNKDLILNHILTNLRVRLNFYSILTFLSRGLNIVTVKAKAVKQTIALAVKEATIAVKGTATIEPTVAPAGLTVTYTSNDPAVATVDAKGVVTGVKAGVAEITCANGTATATFTVTVKDVLFKEVKQTKMNTLEAVVEGGIKNLTKDSFKITNNDTNVAVYTSKIAIDEKKNVVTLTTFTNMSDGKEYTVELDGQKLTFKATDGKVASVNVTPLKITAGSETDIVAQIVDANGVVINEMKYGESLSKVEFKIESKTGYIKNGKYVLPTVGDTATAKVTYHTYEYDANANEVGAISKEFTIEAVENAATVSNFKYTVGDDAPDWTKTVTEVTKFSLSKKNTNAYFYITDSTGADVTKNYVVESGDNGIVLLGETKLTSKTGAVPLVAVKEGTTVLNIKKDGKVVASLPITVSAKTVLKTIKLSTSSITLAAANGEEAADLGITGYDQNGDKIAIASAVAEIQDEISGGIAKGTKFTALKDNNTKLVIDKRTLAGKAKEATYTMIVKAKDADGNESAGVPCKLSVVKADGTVDYRLEAPAEFDLKAVDAKTTTNAAVKLEIVKYANNAKLGTVKSTEANVTITVKNSKGVVKASGTAATLTMSAITVSESSGIVTVTKVLPVDTYTVEITVKTGSGATAVDVKRTAEFKVVDTQAPATASIENLDGYVVPSVAVATAAATKILDGAATGKAIGFKVSYDGKTVEIGKNLSTSGTKFTKDGITISDLKVKKATYNNGSLLIEEATVMIQDTNNGKNIKFEAPISGIAPFTNVTEASAS